MIYNKLGFKHKTEVQERIEGVNKNVLILSSCGSGKTEASYFNMLADNKKTILIEPMQTLANGLCERLNSYNKKLGIEEVTLQHSNDKGDKNLSSKYCVTTIDQVLSGYLALGKQSFIRGKNVLLSNLIFDEVQLFSSDKMLLTTINMLDEINKLGNRFIIMTATMPEYLINLLKDRYDMEVIITNEIRKDRNVTINYIDEINIEEILNYNNKQIIICNTVKQLLDIASKLDEDRLLVLHSKFQLKNRIEIEKEVYKYFGKGSSGNNKILLTTQIVEVGVDISADRLYTALCPIDNLIQRDGRCCRWGGNGEVIVFENSDKIYNKEVLMNTKNMIIDNNGINFTWDIQKDWVNKILNDFYKANVNKVSIKKNKLMFKKGNNSDLIRDIKQVNVIIANKEVEIDDFNRDSISISTIELNNVAKINQIYKLHNKEIRICDVHSIDIGDTIVIQGNNCRYDKYGFRFEDTPVVFNDNIIFNRQNDTNDIKFEDYITEPLIEHCKLTREIFYKKLKEENFNEYIKDNLDNIAFYCGLHDLGKADKEWQRKANSSNILAHFPFSKIRTDRRTHSLISAVILEKYIDKIIYNVILQHHGRIKIEDMIVCSKWDMDRNIHNCLNEYGFNNPIQLTSESIRINKANIITPTNDSWCTLLYLIGTFMECEIQAINTYKIISNKI